MAGFTFDVSIFEIKPGTKLFIYLTVGLGFLVILLSFHYFFLSPAVSGTALDRDRVAAVKDVFDAVVINTLLPMFKILVTGVLGWICIACFPPPLVLNVREGHKITVTFIDSEMTAVFIED